MIVEVEEHKAPNKAGQLALALAKAQIEMKKASKSSKNPHFKSKYADLTEVVESSREALLNNGLAVTMRVEDDYLVATLVHVAGGYIESRFPLRLEGLNLQQVGAQFTYLRRYIYSLMVGIITEDDDDAESVVRPKRTTEAPPYKPEEPMSISHTQYLLLAGKLQGQPDLLSKLLAHYKIKDLSSLPIEKFEEVETILDKKLKGGLL